MLALSLVVTIALRNFLILENRRRDNLSVEQHYREAAIIEPCDWVSSYMDFLISKNYSLGTVFSIQTRATCCNMDVFGSCQNDGNTLVIDIHMHFQFFLLFFLMTNNVKF